MLRSFFSLALGFALVGGSPVTAASAAEVGPAAAADRSTSSVAPQVVERRVRLGHRPIRLRDDSGKVRLTFEGRRGQLVHLASWAADGYPCMAARLWRGGRELDGWHDGYWRLRRSGTYTVRAKRCEDRLDGYVIKVQVRKVAVHEAALDAGPTRAGSDPDRTHLVRVPLAAGDRLVVQHDYQVTHVLMPGLAAPGRVSSSRSYLEAGTSPAYGGALSTAGTHYLVTQPGEAITLTRVLQHQGVLDGPPIELANSGVAERVHVVSFHAPAGAYVYGEVTAASGVVSHQGAVLGRVGETTPTAGTYRLQLTLPGSLAEESFRLRLRSAAVAEPLTLDGPAVTYTATTPGQWVVGTFTEGLNYGQAQVTASDVSPSLTRWGVGLTSGVAHGCPPDEPGGLGCGDPGGYTSLGPSRMTAMVEVGGVPRNQVIFVVPPDVQGSLRLTLTTR